jgi:thiol-disulfide isomerase/thioredoxin
MAPTALVLLLALASPAPGTRVSDRIRGQRVAAEHPAMEAPSVRPAASASHMRDDDIVLGVIVDGAARAYPWWIVKHFHAVNDEIAGVPVAIAFCEQCTGAAAFRRTLDGRVLSMDVPGVYNGTIILKDRETGTLWAPFSGRGLEGPLAGKTLARLPLALVRWGEWKERHPGTDVLWGPDQARGGHGSWYEPGKWGIVGEMGATIESWDARMPENTLVYGVTAGAAAKSYPLAAIKDMGVVNDAVGATPVVIAKAGALEVAGFDRRVRGDVLTFDPAPDSAALLVDRETKSAWSAEGLAVSGALRGAQLARLDGYVVEWHVWSAYNPDARVMATSAPAVAVTERPAFPALTLVPVEGGSAVPLRLAPGVSVVAVWARWCPPCRLEMPVLDALARRHARRALAVVGLALQMPDDAPERDEVRRFLSAAGVKFPNLMVDERGYDELDELARAMGRPGIVLPTVFVVDAGGRVQAMLAGEEVSTLPAIVDRLLGIRAVSAAP